MTIATASSIIAAFCRRSSRWHLIVFVAFHPGLSPRWCSARRSTAIDQGLGFLFGVARGILLVAVAFFVYDTVLSAQDLAMVEDSRSAKVFARFTGQLEEQNPEEALGWITRQYEQLVGPCEAPAETVTPATPPASE